MKKDGFTLVELLAVVIILTILYLFVMPKVTDLIKDGNKTDEYIIQNKIITAAKEYTSNYDTRFLNDFINIGYSKYISKEDLINNKLLDENEVESIGFFKVKVTLKEDNKLEYTISYDDSEKVILSVNLDGGSIISNPSGEYDVGSTITLNTPTKTNYEFSHWSIEVGNSILSGNKLTIGNVNTTIKANWIKKIILTIDLNGGTGNNQGGIYSSNTTKTLEEPMKDDYGFAGWEVVSGDAIVSGNNITFGLEDASVKALWVQETYEFAYTGSEQIFIAPVTGYYKLEVWGASGGAGKTGGVAGGNGGYSTGLIKLKKEEKIYINVGGEGETASTMSYASKGGYNGGGNGRGTGTGKYGSGGGGATHIATKSGLLSTLENYKSSILIVAGGGGAGFNHSSSSLDAAGGQAGGFMANGNEGGNQVNGAAFGCGDSNNGNGSGGGGGYYGGGIGSDSTSSGGGSGYIGNILLTNKSMYCYNCNESNGYSTKTISTTCSNSSATSNCSKKGNGYAKISFVSSNINNIDSFSVNDYEEMYSSNSKYLFITPLPGYYRLETWGAQGGNASSYTGGYGGYSSGVLYLAKDTILYVYPGGKGGNSTGANSAGTAGYNGGGSGGSNATCQGGGGGGGASHIATKDGLLSALSSDLESILIVSGGGGGARYHCGDCSKNGGAGGGIKGTTYGQDAGTQTSGANFGAGGDGSGGGGGGYYGGYGSGWGGDANGSGGGSGYIGNTLLTNKSMYCYNCTSSSEEATKTVSTTCTNKNATENCSKQGNGYAKITYLGE